MRFLFAVAWRNLWRQSRRSLITASAMAIGVAMCMSMIAFMDGMYGQMFDVLVGQKLGHVQMHHPDYPGRNLLHDTMPESVVDEVRDVDGVEGLSARLNGYGLMGGERTSVGVKLVGINPSDEDALTHLSNMVIEGEYLTEESQNQTIIGNQLAEDLSVSIGDMVVIVTQGADGSMGNELLEVSGIFNTGSVSMDKSGAYLHIADLQNLFVLPESVHEVLITAPSKSGIDSLAESVRSVASDNVLVQTWYESDPQTAQMMSLQDVSAVIMLSIVFSVAALGVLNTMLMSVFERTRELGLLKSLGVTPGQVVQLVMIESFLLALLACALGGLLGGVLDWYIVVHGLDMSSGGEGINYAGVTLDPVIHGEVRPGGIVLTLVSVVVVSVLAAIWPAYRAARLHPVEAMRQV